MRFKLALAKNLRIGFEGDSCAAPVGCGTQILDLAERLPLGELLGVELLIPCNLDACMFRQRVDHTDANAVQTTGGGIGFT